MDGGEGNGLKVSILTSQINIFCSPLGIKPGIELCLSELSFNSPFLVFTFVLVSVFSSVSLPLFVPVPALTPTSVPLSAAAPLAAMACSVAAAVAAAPAARPPVARMRPEMRYDYY